MVKFTQLQQLTLPTLFEVKRVYPYIHTYHSTTCSTLKACQVRYETSELIKSIPRFEHSRSPPSGLIHAAMIPSHGQILKLTHSNAIFASWYNHYVTDRVCALSYLLSCRMKNISKPDFNFVVKTALVSQQQSLIARTLPMPHSASPPHLSETCRKPRLVSFSPPHEERD